LTELYPIFVRASRLRCVVIGGGAVAARKIRGLIETGARIKIVAPEINAEVRGMLLAHAVDWDQRAASEDDVYNADLVFLATDNPDLHERLEHAAQRKGALVNRADSPDGGTFHVPAIARRGDIAVAVSTSGRSPTFARLLRDEIQSLLTDERVEQLEVAAQARETARLGVLKDVSR
jgi:siroheme synthase-like protein